MPVAARIAPTHTLRMRTLVMTFPPVPSETHRVLSEIAALRLSPPGFRPRRAAASSRNDADAAGEWFGHRELAVYELKRKRGQGAGGGTGHHRRALARVVRRIMTRAFQHPVAGHPTRH